MTHFHIDRLHWWLMTTIGAGVIGAIGIVLGVMWQELIEMRTENEQQAIAISRLDGQVTAILESLQHETP